METIPEIYPEECFCCNEKETCFLDQREDGSLFYCCANCGLTFEDQETRNYNVKEVWNGRQYIQK